MCKFNRPLGIILSVLLILSSVPLSLTASAETTYYTSDDGYPTYTVENGEAMIIDCDTSISGAYTIPSTLGGYPVTVIGNMAFTSCKSLTSIIIPDGVTRINSSGIFFGAFSRYTSLTRVTIPDNVTSIGSYSIVYSSRSELIDGFVIRGNYGTAAETHTRRLSRQRVTATESGLLPLNRITRLRANSREPVPSAEMWRRRQSPRWMIPPLIIPPLAVLTSATALTPLYSYSTR